MTSKDVSEMKERLVRWNRLDEREAGLRGQVEKVQSISGNHSEVRVCSITIACLGREKVVIEDGLITNWQMRTLLEPILLKHLEAVQKEKREL